jgi:hypothetical protein
MGDTVTLVKLKKVVATVLLRKKQGLQEVAPVEPMALVELVVLMMDQSLLKPIIVGNTMGTLQHRLIVRP